MKKTFQIFGIICAVVFLFLIILIGVVAYKGNKLDLESRTFVKENLAEICATWNADILIKNAAPEFKIQSSDDAVKELFMNLKKLGEVRSIGEPKGQALYSINLQEGKALSASYKTLMTFEKGKYVVTTQLKKDQGQWEFLSFFVSAATIYDN